MPTTTAIQALPVPIAGDPPNIPADLDTLAKAIETRLNMRFANSGDRDSKVTAPVEGMMCCLTQTRQYQFYSNGAWRTFYSQGTGSEARYGHVTSYETSTRPTGVNPGTIGYNRVTRRIEGFDTTSNWKQVGAYGVSFGNFNRIGGGGTNIPAGSTSDAITASIAISEANTTVLLIGNSQWQAPAGTGANAEANFPVTVETSLRVTPPGAGGGAGTANNEITRYKETQLIYNGVQSAGVTPCSHTYLCTAVGLYTFRLRLEPTNSNVNNLGGQLNVIPIISTQAL